MKSERYEPKQYIENANESCHYCHKTTLQQVGDEKVCAHCGTRVYSTAAHSSMSVHMAAARRSLGSR